VTQVVITEIRGAFGTGVDTVEKAQAQAHAFEIAWQFADASLLDTHELADLILEACADTLRHRREPTVDAEPIANHLVKQLGRALDKTSIGRVHDLQAALTDGDDWLSNRLRDRLRLSVAVRAAQLGADPPDADWVAELAHDWENGLATEFAGWITVIAPSPKEAWNVLYRLACSPPEPVLADGLRQYTDGLTRAQRFELLEPALTKPFEGVAVQFLEAAGLSQVEPRQAVPLLVHAAAAASNDEQRRHVLKLWQALGPQGDTPRRQLIEGVWLPFAHGGATSLRTALEHFALIDPAPRGMQRALVKELRSMQIKNDNLAKLLDRRLLATGWIKKDWLGRRKEA
jgi:hypothetical protein